MTQGSFKACIVCPYVCMLTTFLKISIWDVSMFFCMWLRIFNLKKLMQFNFRERLKFEYKVPKLEISSFFKKTCAIWFLRLNLNESSCSSDCKLCVKKTLFLRYGTKCFWPISLQNLQKSNIILWKSIDSHWFKNTLFDLFNLQLRLFFFHKITKFYKSICSAWVSRTFAEFSAHKLTSYTSYKYNRNIFDPIKRTSIDFIWRNG